MQLTRKQYRALELLVMAGAAAPYDEFKDILGPLDDMGLVVLAAPEWTGGKKYYSPCAETFVALLEERPAA